MMQIGTSAVYQQANRHNSTRGQAETISTTGTDVTTSNSRVENGSRNSVNQYVVDPVNKAEATKPSEVGDNDAPQGKDFSEKLQLSKDIQNFSKRDQEVRTHERIHASLAGPYGGSPQFQFQRGPDGVLYAVSGSVSIDASSIPGNPEATERKARTIQRAALGPAEPSGADRAIAAKAAVMAANARTEITNALVTRESMQLTPGQQDVYGVADQALVGERGKGELISTVA